ncbi:Phosphoribosylaminoimidazole-succinocarboxamide synthase [Saezia sanguinis]|uniref:Phosphoribosylaminoimidazole-succinocarboxamide synthase n=2 Tax=Saezia sanguinis TaxID=1965230 RepID=A0A433SC08_9BURK|nr:Phosphoribosylaminoimidazole-succinocarboxamide synthase [Saezia sanguinis]
MMNSTVLDPAISSLPLLSKGKVRNNYAVGKHQILMVASDRLSAFDVILDQPIPGKGILLTQMALFWFERLKHIVPNHLTGIDPQTVVTKEEIPQIQGRAMLVKRLQPVMVEAVVRGYLAGSGWKEYQQSQTICGVGLPAGLHNADQLPEPIFTPAAKAAVGEHDENITFAEMSNRIGASLARQIQDISVQLYQQAAAFALTKGIIIADTKFEFGIDDNGQLTLMDEILTPDSSRYWPVDGYETAHAAGQNPPSYDKQFVRDWLEAVRIDGKPWNKQPPAPTLPEQVMQQTAMKYQEAFTKLQG